MSVASVDPEVSFEDVKIGAPTHMARNLFVLLGVGAVVAAFIVFNSYQSKQDATKLQALDTMRGLYAQTCDAPQWNEQVPPVVRDTYLNSSHLQGVVEAQTAALRAGASCEDVTRALRAADFPMPAKVIP